jgi:hypothetical protein
MRPQFLLLLAAILPAKADWTRYLTGPKGAYSSPAPPRPLAYFRHDAFLRPETCDCTEEQRAAEEKAGVEKNSRAEVVKVGEVTGFEVYDVRYQYEGVSLGKSVIVRTGADEYREIFYGGPYTNDAGFYPTSILSAGEDQTFLWFRVDYGGNRHSMEDFLFHVDSKGVTRLNLDPLWQAAKSVLPVGGGASDQRLELTPRATAFILQAPVYNDCDVRDPNPCKTDIRGMVEVDFRLDGDRLTPLGRRYIP